MRTRVAHGTYLFMARLRFKDDPRLFASVFVFLTRVWTGVHLTRTRALAHVCGMSLNECNTSPGVLYALLK